jgi:hypothetical protein
MDEPPGLSNTSLNTFQANHAAYGSNWATEGCQLNTPADEYEITTSGAPIPFVLGPC